MENRELPSNPSGRRFYWLAGAIVAAIAVYSAIWFYLAGQLESRSRDLLNNLGNRDIVAECQDLEVRGYPFRLGLFCSGVSANDAASATVISTGGFRSAAQIYKPNHIVSELDGPVAVKSGPGIMADLDWSLLRASTVFNLSGLSRASMESKDATAALTVDDRPVQVNADASELHTRQNNADLDTVLRLFAAQVTVPELADPLPKMDLQADVTLADRAWLLSGQRALRDPLRDLSASLNNFNADMANGAGLSADGPFSVDASGNLSGKFNVEIRGLAAWQELIATLLPDRSEQMESVSGILSTMGGGQDTISLPVNITEGTVRVGIIPVGKIPPL